MGGREQTRWGESTLQKPLSCPRGQEGLRFWWVLRGNAKFISFENAGYNRSHVSASSRWNGSQRSLREAKTLRFSGCEARPFLLGRDKRTVCWTSCGSQETWRRCSWKIAQGALWNTRRELQIRKVMIALGFKQGKSNPCIYFHAGRDLRTVVSSPWRWFYNSWNFWKNKMTPWRTFKEMEMHWARYFGTARDTRDNPGHQSPEQNYHMERRWYLMGTRL